MAAECKAAPGGLEGFPTWVIGDQKLVGEQSFDALEAALEKLAASSPRPGGASDNAAAAVAAVAGS